MTILRKSATNNNSIVRNYVINSAASGNILASNNGKPYTEGTVFIKNNTDSLLFNYNIMNYNNIMKTAIYGLIGKEFNIQIDDFASGSNVGLTITNNESTALIVSIIQQL